MLRVRAPRLRCDAAGRPNQEAACVSNQQIDAYWMLCTPSFRGRFATKTVGLARPVQYDWSRASGSGSRPWRVHRTRLSEVESEILSGILARNHARPLPGRYWCPARSVPIGPRRDPVGPCSKGESERVAHAIGVRDEDWKGRRRVRDGGIRNRKADRVAS